MEIPSALKTALSWLVGALAFVLVFLGLTVLYMVLTKADWLRALLGVKS